MIQSYIETLRENAFRIPRDIEAAQEQSEEKLGDAKSAFVSKEKRMLILKRKFMNTGCMPMWNATIR